MKPTSNKLRKTAAKVAYLTFDDGPLKNTAKILAVLKQLIKGIFLLLAARAPMGFVCTGKYTSSDTASGIIRIRITSQRFMRVRKHFSRTFIKWSVFFTKRSGLNPVYSDSRGLNTRKGFARGGQKTIRAIKAALRLRGYLYSDWDIDSADTTLPGLPSRK